LGKKNSDERKRARKFREGRPKKVERGGGKVTKQSKMG